MASPLPPAFDDHELASIIEGSLRAQALSNHPGATDADLERVVDWCWKARMEGSLLALILEQRLGIYWDATRQDLIVRSIEEVV